MSTASMGKFDRRLEGEKPGERQMGQKRRKFEPLIGDIGAEKTKVCFVSLVLQISTSNSNIQLSLPPHFIKAAGKDEDGTAYLFSAAE